VTGTLTCPRCGREVRPPGLWSDTWTCPVHAAVAPLHPAMVGSDDALRQLGLRSQVPIWLPWPLPLGWLVSGIRYAGDEHTGPIATVLACSGPNPLTVDVDELSADLLLVAEQPGVGLGARLAGIEALDPGGRIIGGSPGLKLVAAGHDTPLWAVDVDDVSAFVGEAAGVWLWAITWPSTAAAVLLEQFELRDACDPDNLFDLPYGALSPRLD
jgi:hypothetical protein